MLLRKEQGGCTIGSYTWEDDGDVVEVPDDFGASLLAIPGGDFEFVEPGGAPPADPPADDPPADDPPAAPPAPPKGSRRSSKADGPVPASAVTDDVEDGDGDE